MRGGLAGAALALLVAGPLQAQRITTELFGYLGYSRASFTHVTGAEALTQRWVGGATGGLGIRHPLTGAAGLRGELLLARRGGAFGFELEGEEVSLSLDLVYLEVPLQLQLQSYRRDQRFRPFAFLGVVPSFKLGCDAEGRGPAGLLQRPCDEVMEQDPEWFELGASGGAGVEYRQGRTHLQLQVRLYQSFSDLAADLDVSNRTFALVLGVGM
jgi:hypothetical protein